MFERIWDIFIRVIYFLLILFCILFLINMFFKHVPVEKIPVDVQLTAYKMDDNGNEIDTFPITITGHIKKYLFHDDRLDVYITPFDNYKDFLPHKLGDTPGGLFDLGGGCSYTIYHATGISGYEYFYIYFSEDLEKWAFVVEKYMYENPFYINNRYVASCNPNAPFEDVKNYFGGLLRLE